MSISKFERNNKKMVVTIKVDRVLNIEKRKEKKRKIQELMETV
jgi:hypothetical protein